MLVPSQKYVRNRLLAALDPAAYQSLHPTLDAVTLTRGDVLIRPNEAVSHIHFVEAGIVSMVANTDERRLEIGLVGREGFVGVPILLDVDRTPFECFVQVEGHALRTTVEAFQALTEDRASRALLTRYAHVWQVQTGQTALSNGSFSLEERLARWLLMCHDRVDGDEFPLTHEFLSIMLGVRRSGVTTTIHVLEGMGAIRARRSRIEVMDRGKLEATAGEGYGVAEAEYRRLISERS